MHVLRGDCGGAQRADLCKHFQRVRSAFLRHFFVHRIQSLAEELLSVILAPLLLIIYLPEVLTYLGTLALFGHFCYRLYRIKWRRFARALHYSMLVVDAAGQTPVQAGKALCKAPLPECLQTLLHEVILPNAKKDEDRKSVV